MNGNNLKVSDSPEWCSPLKWRSYVFAYLEINKLDQCCQLGMDFFLNRYFPRNTMMEMQAKGGGEGLYWQVLGCAVTIQGGSWPCWLLLYDKQVRLQQALPLCVWVETFLWGRQIFPSLEPFSGPRLAPGMDFHFPLGKRFKVHMICRKGMSAGGGKEKRCYVGEKEGKMGQRWQCLRNHFP